MHLSQWIINKSIRKSRGNASEGITLQIEKKAETAEALNAYIYLIMDAQLNTLSGVCFCFILE